MNMDPKSPVTQVKKTDKPTENGDNKMDKNRTVFPPCDTSPFLPLPLDKRHESLTLISLAQFRPEKDHAKQLRALGILFSDHPEWREKGVRLVLMGSCRDKVDEAKVESLTRLARELHIEVSLLDMPKTLMCRFPDLASSIFFLSIGLGGIRPERFFPPDRPTSRPSVYRAEHDEG